MLRQDWKKGRVKWGKLIFTRRLVRGKQRHNLKTRNPEAGANFCANIIALIVPVGLSIESWFVQHHLARLILGWFRRFR